MKKLIVVAVIAGLVVWAMSALQKLKDELSGLSEAELRSRLDAKLAFIPDENRTEAIDGIVAKMHESGLVTDEAPVSVDADTADEPGAE